MVTVCTECGHETRSGTPHCAECGAADPWEERPAFEFDPQDLPIVFSYEVYDDGNGLWEAFCEAYFGTPELTGSDIAGIPDAFPKLEYCMADLWFRITEDYDVEGPFLSRSAARAGEEENP